jgi:hypothetical protein
LGSNIKRLERRPALDRLLDDVRAGKVALVAVWKLDRGNGDVVASIDGTEWYTGSAFLASLVGADMSFFGWAGDNFTNAVCFTDWSIWTDGEVVHVDLVFRGIWSGLTGGAHQQRYAGQPRQRKKRNFLLRTNIIGSLQGKLSVRCGPSGA